MARKAPKPRKTVEIVFKVSIPAWMTAAQIRALAKDEPVGPIYYDLDDPKGRYRSGALKVRYSATRIVRKAAR